MSPSHMCLSTYKENTISYALDTKAGHSGQQSFKACLVTNLQVKVTWFGVKSQVNSVSVVTNDVLGSRVLAVTSSHQLL